MKKTFLKILRITLPLLLGVFIIYYSYNQFTQDQIEEIRSYIVTADYKWVFLSVFLAFLSHLSRAWRWNYMLQAMRYKPSFLTNVIAIGAGYAMNIFIPRSGEVARAAIINRSDQVPVDKALGTIIAERVLDVIMLLLITATAVLSAGNAIIDFFKDNLNSAFAKADTSKLFLYLSIFLLLIVLVVFIAKKVQLIGKIKGFLYGMKEGFMTIWTMKKKWLYLLHTLFIWGMYITMFYVTIYAIPGIASIPLSAILCAFVAGSFAVAFTNGGFGAYPYFIAQVLLIFGIEETLGSSFGWLLWLSQTSLVLVYGLVSLVLLALRGSLSRN